MICFDIQSFSACQTVFRSRIPSFNDLAFSVCGQGSGPEYPSLKIEFKSFYFEFQLSMAWRSPFMTKGTIRGLDRSTSV